MYYSLGSKTDIFFYPISLEGEKQITGWGVCVFVYVCVCGVRD